jgi:TatA/E family protein of Tat protein translocase
MFDFLKNIGSGELIIIVLIIAGLFGKQKAKDLAESMGRSAKELNKAKQDLEDVKSEIVNAVGGVKSDV